MRRFLFAAALAAMPALLCAQTSTTVYTGTIRDLTGSAVTSGRITWTINAPSGGVIPGTGTFVANTVSCSISSGGHPVATSDGVSPCTIINNSALTPTGTYYTLCIQAGFVTPGSCINTFATGGTVDMSVLVPTPTTQPYYGIATAAPSLSNNQSLQSGNASGALGGTVKVTTGNVIQLGDLDNKFGTLGFYFGGNSYQTVDGAGAHFTVPTDLSTLTLNGSVGLTGARGNGSSVQTYSTGAAVGPACFALDGSITNTSCTNGSTISLTTSGTSGAATLSGGVLNIPNYAATGSGVGYTTPTVTFLPTVTSSTGNGTMGNSTFSDDTVGQQAAVGDPLNINGGASLTAQTADSTHNKACQTLSLGLSYWNAGAVSDAYTLGCFVNPGSAPTTLVTLYGPSTLSTAVASNGVGLLLAQNAGLTATFSQNINSPKLKFRGTVYNGTGSQNLDWNLQGIHGTGANPSSTFTFGCTGTAGQCSVSVPALVVPSGSGSTPGVKFTAAAFSTYPICSGNEGLEEAVTDSTTAVWGATVTGGGANHVKMYCDGTNWTVVGK